MSVPTKETVLKRLLLAHRAYFDVQENHEYQGRVFPGYAEFHSHGEQYVLVKRAKLWEVDAHQYLFFVVTELLDERLLDDLVGFMKNEALGKVEPRPNHMSSDLVLVVVADSVDQGAATKLKRVRFRKSYRFGLWGWSDLKLAAVDLAGRRVVSNGAGKELCSTLESNAWQAELGRSA